MKEQEVLARNIKRYRLFKGLDQKDLAKEAGLSSAVISRLERGIENIGINNLLKIAKELDVPIEELFMQNPKDVSIKFTIAENNLEAFRKLLGQVEYILQRKKQ